MDKIVIDIDCTKINKKRLKLGKYLKALLVPTPNNKYGSDFFISELTTDEERQAGVMRGDIIGNARFMILKKPEDAAHNPPKPVDSGFDTDDDIPF